MRNEFGHLVTVHFLPVAFKYGVHLLVGQVVVEVVVHLNGRRPAAGSDALDFFQREDAVRRGLFVTDAEPVLAMREHLIAAAQHAGDVSADLHVEFAMRFGMQQGVVADDVAYIEFGDLDAPRDLGDHCVGNGADLILRVKQHRDERRPAHRIEGHEFVEARRQLRRKNRVRYWMHLWAHRMISRASRSATMSISSASPSMIKRPCSSSVNSVTAPVSRVKLPRSPSKRIVKSRSPARTSTWSSLTSSTACRVPFSPCAAV